MPAQFDLFRFGERTEEFWFVAIEETRLLRGNFFSSFRRAHPQNRIIAPETLGKLAKTARLSLNAFGHFVSASDRALVRAVEKICYVC